MNCAVFTVAPSVGRVFGLPHNQHADGLTFAYCSHTGGGVGVRRVCPLSSLLRWVAGIYFLAAHLIGGVGR